MVGGAAGQVSPKDWGEYIRRKKRCVFSFFFPSSFCFVCYFDPFSLSSWTLYWLIYDGTDGRVARSCICHLMAFFFSMERKKVSPRNLLLRTSAKSQQVSGKLFTFFFFLLAISRTLMLRIISFNRPEIDIIDLAVRVLNAFKRDVENHRAETI